MSDDNDILKLRLKREGNSKLRRAIYVVLLLSLVAGLILTYKYFFIKKESRELSYLTEEAKISDLIVTVSATGNLQPLNKVDVGVEISGTISKIEVDFNHRVKEGQVLARLDTSRLEAQLEQSKAAVNLAKAKLKAAHAELFLAKTKLEQLKQARELSGGRVPSKAEMDTAEANLQKIEAEIEQIKAEIQRAEADLKYNQTNLEKAIVRSPLNGIVLSRNVEPGQTVAASLQTPVLFSIAEDLTKMELVVDVDEADVARVKEGQEANFVVDAYPDQNFKAVVKEVRLSPKATQGVVTYQTVLSVDNPLLLLKPGMTATAEIIVKKVKDVLLIPNSALRFAPPEPKTQAQRPGGILGAIFPFRPPATRPSLAQDKRPKGRERTVYKLQGKDLVPVKVIVGETDGKMRAVMGGDLKPGDQVVIGSVEKKR